MVIANIDHCNPCHFRQVQASVVQGRNGSVSRFNDQSMATLQVECELPGRFSSQAVESAGKLSGIAKIGGGDQIVEPMTELLGGQMSKGARGELVVMAQPLQFFRREQYIQGRIQLSRLSAPIRL